MPTKQEILEYEQALADSDEEKDDKDSNVQIMNGHQDDDNDDDIFIIRDDHNKKILPEPPQKERKEYPPFPAVKYEVVEIEAWDYKEPKVNNELFSFNNYSRNLQDLSLSRVEQCTLACYKKTNN